MLYPKIYTIFKREESGKRNVTPMVNSSHTIQALNLIKSIIVEEKIDGTNSSLKINYDFNDGINYRYFGRQHEISNQPDYKDNNYIRQTIDEVIDFAQIKDWYIKNFVQTPNPKDKEERTEFPEITIFAECYGYGIQKQNYLSKGERDIRVFDIRIGNSWLSSDDRNKVCRELGLKVVPRLCVLNSFPTFEEAYDLLFKTYPKSVVAKENGNDMFLEGFVLKPKISLYTNNYRRILGKIKRSDYLLNKL